MYSKSFLAPTGALETTISVRLSVCPFGSSLSRALFLHLFVSLCHSLSLSISQQAYRQSHICRSLSILRLVIRGLLHREKIELGGRWVAHRIKKSSTVSCTWIPDFLGLGLMGTYLHWDLHWHLELGLTIFWTIYIYICMRNIRWSSDADCCCPQQGQAAGQVMRKLRILMAGTVTTDLLPRPTWPVHLRVLILRSNCREHRKKFGNTLKRLIAQYKELDLQFTG